MTISEQRRKDLEKAVKLTLIQKEARLNPTNYCAYNKFYKMTNENQLSLWKNFELSSDKQVLTVLSSGDQMFNLINKGVTDIDTFDINRLTEYYALGFKKRAIEALTYFQFEKLFCLYKKKMDLEEYVIGNMDGEYKWFWQEYKYALKQQGYDASIFDLAISSEPGIWRHRTNNYLETETAFSSLQQKLINANIKFQCANIKDLPTKFGTYDLIYLSNIFDYYDEILYPQYSCEIALKKAIELTKEIFAKNLKTSGEMLFSYFGDAFIYELFLEKIINVQENTYYAPAQFPHVKGLKKLWD